MKKSRRGAIVLVSTLAALSLAIAPTIPAFAAVNKSGTTYCALPKPYPWLQSTASLIVTHKGPGSSPTLTFINGSTPQVRQSTGAGTGGAWLVTSSGTLSNPGTYGFCSAYN